ncbi:aminoacyl-tRNA hydrolase [Helicovermis profundi]|uniref:Peptidyl-tRNA hydrolase n=1 Tax=Helicovermis profundi TaxID=3065157 RepID=A0AAU9EN69_9FIRM|nr:aminoacyl-tRNA hydrolase [Clostridia bacterium S502]
MYIVVGLGNPGKKYSGTKHNIGFETIDYMARKYDIKVIKSKHKALIGEGIIENEKVIFVKPQTFMNLSGESVMKIVNYYDIPLDKLILIYDDIDTELGKIRIRKKGSAGTHNGMKNIIYLLNDDNFTRIRIGIGKPSRDLVDYVLSGFKKEEIPLIEESVITASNAVASILKDDVDKAMNLYNKR